jgi:hypothetical protein
MIDDKGFFRTDPHHHGTDGFFAAILEKSGGHNNWSGRGVEIN